LRRSGLIEGLGVGSWFRSIVDTPQPKDEARGFDGDVYDLPSNPLPANIPDERVMLRNVGVSNDTDEVSHGQIGIYLLSGIETQRIALKISSRRALSHHLLINILRSLLCDPETERSVKLRHQICPSVIPILQGGYRRWDDGPLID
jgi:hypothetical protein